MTILRNLKNLFTAVATIDSFKSWNLQKHPNNSMYLNGEFPYNSHDNIKLYKDITISNSSVTTACTSTKRKSKMCNKCLPQYWHCYVKSVGNSHYKYTEQFD